MMRKTLLAVLISGAMVTGVQAAGNQVNGYLFGNIGQADADASKVRNELDVVAEYVAWELDLDQGHSSFDEKDSAFKIGVGIQLNQYVAVEFQYLDLGEISHKARGAGTFNGRTGNMKTTADTDGFGANLVGTLPFERFKLFGKLGYHKLKTDVKSSISINDPMISVRESGSDDTTEWVTSYGIGASYAFTPQVELAAEFERYQDVADEYDVDMASIGLRYNF